jgi:AcrR family transcriptional regulator
LLPFVALNGTVSYMIRAGGQSKEEPGVSDAPTIERTPKCAQVLEGARKVFMEHGYEGASVDEIARAAGTSKATLYSYFPDKRQLFEAVVRTQCSRQGQVICSAAASGESVEATLQRLATSFVAFVFSPGAQEMFRVCIAESGRFPEIGTSFYAAGPARAHARLVDFFQEASANGTLDIDDPAIAADQFTALCKAGLFLRALLGAPQPTEAEVTRIAEEAVRTFLARYGARQPAAAAPKAV